MIAEFLRTRWRRLHAICLTLVAIGCLLHLTIRDWIPFPVAAIFYALPRPLLLLLSILACVTAADSRRRWEIAGLSVLLAGWVAWKDIVWNSPAPVLGVSHTVVFWNVGHDLEHDTAVVDEFLNHAPIALGLVETGPISAEWLAAWHDRHPEYEYAVPYQGMFLAVRGHLTAQGRVHLSHNSHAQWVETDLDSRRTRIAVVDIAANPWISRKEPLLDLSQWLAGSDDIPVILMGDFNTPVESVWFRGLRTRFREAFLAAGRGYIPTWPSPAPALKLDQIWVNRFIGVSRAWQQFTWHSDHRAQWAEIELRVPSSDLQSPDRALE